LAVWVIGRAFALIVTGAIGALLTLFAVVVVARNLGPAGIGVYQGITRWIAIATTAGGLSIGQAMSYLWSRRPQDPIPVRASLVASAVLTIPIVIALAVVLPSLLNLDANARSALLVVLVSVPFALAVAYLGHLSRAAGDDSTFNLSRLCQPSFLLATVLLASAAGVLGLLPVAFAYSISIAITLAVMLALGIRAGWITRSHVQPPWRPLVSYALRAHPLAVARDLNLYLDQLIIAAVMAPATLGIYAAAVSATTTARVVAGGLVYLAQPEVQRADAADTGRALAAVARLTIVIMTPVTLLMIVALPLVLPLVYGPAFADAVQVGVVLSLGIVPESLAVSLASGLVGAGLARTGAIAQIAGLLITVVGLTLVLPAGGALGAAIVSVAAYSCSALAAVLLTARALHVTARAMLVPRTSDFRRARSVIAGKRT